MTTSSRWRAAGRTSTCSPEPEALAAGDGQQKFGSKSFLLGVLRQQELTETRVGGRQPVVAHAVLVHDQAEILPTLEGHAVAGGHEHDELHLLRFREAGQDLPEHRQVSRLFLLRPTLVGGTKPDCSRINRDGPATDDFFQLHRVDHAPQEGRSAQYGAEAVAERVQLLRDSVAEEPVHISLHELALGVQCKPALLRQAAADGPTQVAEHLTDVLLGIIQDALQTLCDLLANHGDVLQAQWSCARGP
mmetsp:Transcript_52551/g.151490  ORF Transcript_52551/g.151490 Transcript_52551/m.151490 type:complete len:247 (-) Transcript_52551:1947-2687(-)